MSTRDLLRTDLTPIYDEVADFLASSPTAQQIADYHLSPEADRIIAALLEANRTRGLALDEQTALDEYTRIERLMRVMKLRAYARRRGSMMNLLDVVALVEDLPEANLKRRQVGTIMEEWSPGVYEVEFSDLDGRTYAMSALRAEQLMTLYWHPAARQTA